MVDHKNTADEQIHLYEGAQQGSTTEDAGEDEFNSGKIAALGCLLGFAALLGAVLLPYLMSDPVDGEINTSLREYLILNSSSAGGFLTWTNSDLAGAARVRWTAWAYNVVNPAEVLTGKAPVVAQVGPFEFTQHRMRYNVTWSSGARFVRYTERTSFRAVGGPGLQAEAMAVTTLNTVYQALVAWLGAAAAMQIAQNTGFNTSNGELDWKRLLFTTRNASELLWGIEKDVLLDAALEVYPHLPKRIPGLASRLGRWEEMEMATGVNNTADMRQLTLWRGQRRVRCCAAPPCRQGPWAANVVTGTLGEQWAPGLGSSPNMTGWRAWSSDKFRSIRVNEASSVTRYVEGHRVKRILPDHSASSRGFNISICSDGIPYTITRPLYKARAAGDGGEESFWDVEPRSGMTLHSQLGRQLNMRVEAGQGRGPLQSMLVPLAWGEEVLTASNSSGVLSILAREGASHEQVKTARIVCVIIGAGLIITAVAFLAVQNSATQATICGITHCAGANHMSPLNLPCSEDVADGYAVRARSMSCAEVQQSFGHEDDFARHQQVERPFTPPSPQISKFVRSLTMGHQQEQGENDPEDLEGFEEAKGQPSIGPRLGMLDDRLLQGSSPGPKDISRQQA